MHERTGAPDCRRARLLLRQHKSASPLKANSFDLVAERTIAIARRRTFWQNGFMEAEQELAAERGHQYRRAPS